MNLTFHSSHLDTLNKLNELAKKHNAVINFGTNNDHSNTDDYLIKITQYFDGKYKEALENDDVLDEIFDKFLYDNESSVWFELKQIVGDKTIYHVMAYNENNLNITLQRDWKEKLEERMDGIEDKEAKKVLSDLIKFIDEERSYEYDFLELEDHYTEIRGFGNKERIKDHRVYRQDMALHYFMKLVCDYLQEEHINNTY